ncbi:PilN domain-containing protein [Cylindrospermum sp. FACHB-282]|uniref:PilN domain-containing protein n=1 Tax=Cylindrospermum sp. FACHB-282 TaxID=2692794 RepID=UPI001687B996|nr:PilN domain-containing protein [Cylindrospermum sp. FACHB-282]MBD2387753.1 PilN domain-containing protein [Cylindrospermum sp. FACHB-282]
MYSLDINFLKDRPAYQKNSDKKPGKPVQIGDLRPVYLGVGIGLCFPLLVASGWLFLQTQSGNLAQEIAKLEQEKAELDSKIGNINKIQKETIAIQGETQALVTVFDQIRPWSAMLQDLRDRIPALVQIDNIRQIAPIVPTKGEAPTNTAGGLEINGFASSFNDVNDFLLSLEQSKFLKSSESKIITAELVDAPLQVDSNRSSVPIKPPKIVKYTIQSSLTEVPASQLIQELEKKGTVGLVARIRSMQQTGVIPK